MMDKKLETIEVNILSDDDIIKEKFTYNANGTDHALNDARLASISDDVTINNGLPSDKNQSTNDNVIDDHQSWNIRKLYKQLRSLCFPENSKKAERQQRIEQIMVSINSIEVDLNKFPNETYFCKHRCNKRMVEISLLGIAIFTVIAIFMIPVILYYTGPPIRNIDGSPTEFFKTCMSSCSNLTGSSQVCEGIAPCSFIPPFVAPSQDAAEEILAKTFNVTSTNAQCNSDVISFFCKAVYRSRPSNISRFPTPRECEMLKSHTCNTEWSDIQTVAPTLTCCNSYNLDPVCPNHFDQFCRICAPLCHEFSQFEDATTIALHVVTGIAMIVGDLAVGIIVFVTAILKRKTVFHFPNVLILYVTAANMLYGIFAVLPLFWRRELLCSHDNLFIALTKSTTFCQMQGFALDACIIIFTEFWLLYIFHLFMKIVDPFKSWIINRPEHSRKVHIIEVVAVFVLGLIVPTITVTAMDGYNLATFPPSQCYSDAEVFFHGIMLPTIVMCIVGISLILITLFHIHRTTGIFKKMKKKRTFTLSVPEVKLLLVSFYLTVVLGASLIQFTRSVRTLNDRVDAIMDYSLCVANGNCNCDDEKEMVENTSIPETTFLFFFTIMFLNCSNLLFVIQLKDVKRVVRRVTKSFIDTELS